MLKKHKPNINQTNRRASKHNAHLKRQFDRGLIVDTNRVINLELDSERTPRYDGNHQTNIRTLGSNTKGGSRVYKKSSFSLLRAGLSSMLFIIIIAGFVWLLRVSAVKIKLVGVTDSVSSSNIIGDYEKEIKRLNQLNFWGLMPIVSSPQISSDIKIRHPEIESINIKRQFPGKSLNAEIVLRQPVLVWQTSRGNRYFVDKTSHVFTKNHTQRTTSSLPLVIDRTIADMPPNNMAPVSQGTIDYIVAFDGAATTKLPKNKQIESFNLSIAPNGLNIKLTDTKYVVRLQSTGDVGQDSEMLRRALKYFNSYQSLTPSKYLDLRLVGRGYYQ